MARLTPDNETVSLNSGSDRIHLKITSPSAGVPADLAYHVPAATTVNDIKSMISESLDSKPANDMQKLIYRGRILDGASTVGEAVVLGSVEDSYTLHLVLVPPRTPTATSSSSPEPFSTSNFTTAAFRPDTPRRYSPTSFSTPATTTTETNTLISSQTYSSSSTPAMTTPSDSTTSLSESSAHLQRLQEELQNSRDTLARLRRAHADILTSPTPPASLQTIRDTLAAARSGFEANPAQMLRNRINGLNSVPNMSLNLPTAEETINANRRYFDSLHQEEATSAASATPRPASAPISETAATPATPATAATAATAYGPLHTIPIPTPTAPTAQTIPPNALVYLLQDSFGRPHSLLVGPPGSALTNPPIFTPGISYPPAESRTETAATRAAELAAIRARIEDLLARAPERPGAAARVAGLRRRIRIRQPLVVRIRSNHIWLALKLAVFVVLFSGHGGWERMVTLIGVAVTIFAWETGLAGWVVGQVWGPGGIGGIGGGAAGPGAGPGPGAQDGIQGLRPDQMAERLMGNRPRDGTREMVRNIERAVMVFVASLVPGWHDRRVEMIERQHRLQREQREALMRAMEEAAAGAGAAEGPGNANQDGEVTPTQATVGEQAGQGQTAQQEQQQRPVEAVDAVL